MTGITISGKTAPRWGRSLRRNGLSVRQRTMYRRSCPCGAAGIYSAGNRQHFGGDSSEEESLRQMSLTCTLPLDGSDAADGLSQETALQTITGANALLTANPFDGDVIIHFAAGEYPLTPTCIGDTLLRAEDLFRGRRAGPDDFHRRGRQ